MYFGLSCTLMEARTVETVHLKNHSFKPCRNKFILTEQTKYINIEYGIIAQNVHWFLYAKFK